MALILPSGLPLIPSTSLNWSSLLWAKPNKNINCKKKSSSYGNFYFHILTIKQSILYKKFI